MKYIYQNSIVFIILMIVILFGENIVLFLGNISSIFIKDDNTIVVELDSLKKENIRLKSEINQLNELTKLYLYDGFEYEVSKILIRDIYQFYETIVIEKGRNYDIEVGNAVVSNNGLVGIINKVNKKTSEVLLITSKNIELSIKVGEAFGILSGYEKNYLVGSKISNYDDFNIGDNVYTSGLGELPTDLYIGRVKEIKTDNYNIEQQIYIDSEVDLDNLKYLIIIKGSVNIQ